MKLLATTLLMFVSLSTFAQVQVQAQAPATTPTAWRCGAEGRSYSDQPCAQGRAVAVADTRTPHELAQAQSVVARERALAKALVAERHEREREVAARGSGLIAIKPVAPAPRAVKEAAKKPKKSKPQHLEALGTSASTARASRPTRG